MALSPHSRIGQYEILGLVGAGGMGEVYRARDEKLGREIALKVLPETFSEDAERLARFEREARAVAALSHPNIVAIHDFANEGGRVYAVMELLEGDTLAERLRAGALPQRKAVEIASQIARGLAAAHDKSVTHRDLKPGNVFVTRNGRVKIFDFGLARTEEGTPTPDDSELVPTRVVGTSPGVVMGTVGYMSPEQVRGESVDHRSDVFSFGAILYEMLSGCRAFQQDTAAETMTAILKEDPLERIDTMPLALARIMERCLEKKREERFQSAHDLAFALDSLTRDSGASATVDAPRPSRWVRAFGLASALIASLALGYFLWRSPRGSDVASPSYQRLTFRRRNGVLGAVRPHGTRRLLQRRLGRRSGRAVLDSSGKQRVFGAEHRRCRRPERLHPGRVGDPVQRAAHTLGELAGNHGNAASIIAHRRGPSHRGQRGDGGLDARWGEPGGRPPSPWSVVRGASTRDGSLRNT